MKMGIKKATLADVEMIASLFNAYRIFCQKPSDIPAAIEFLTERISKNESTIFMAIIAGEVIGFVQLYPIFSSVRLKPAWLLNDLFVAEKARRQGVGRALLDAAKNVGLENNACCLLLQTACDNYKAQSLYEKNSWIKQTDYFYELPLTS